MDTKEIGDSLRDCYFKLIDFRFNLVDEIKESQGKEKQKKIKQLKEFKVKQAEFESNMDDLFLSLAKNLSNEAKQVTKEMEGHISNLKKVVDDYTNGLKAVDAAMTVISEFVKFIVKAAVTLGKKAATSGVA